MAGFVGPAAAAGEWLRHLASKVQEEEERRQQLEEGGEPSSGSVGLRGRRKSEALAVVLAAVVDGHVHQQLVAQGLEPPDDPEGTGLGPAAMIVSEIMPANNRASVRFDVQHMRDAEAAMAAAADRRQGVSSSGPRPLVSAQSFRLSERGGRSRLPSTGGESVARSAAGASQASLARTEILPLIGGRTLLPGLSNISQIVLQATGKVVSNMDRPRGAAQPYQGLYHPHQQQSSLYNRRSVRWSAPVLREHSRVKGITLPARTGARGSGAGAGPGPLRIPGKEAASASMFPPLVRSRNFTEQPSYIPHTYR